MTEPYMMPAGRYAVDVAALKALKAVYWGTQGWREGAKPDEATAALLRAAGLWTDLAHRELTHDRIVTAAAAAAARTSPADVRSAFVGSLRSRRLDLRSALASLAYVRHMPAHRFSPLADGDGPCRICGTADTFELADPNMLNFERFNWGGVRRDELEYCVFDLLQFARAPQVAPDDEDYALLAEIIDTLRSLPPRTTANRAAAALTMLPGNKDERTGFLEILAVCGILQTARCPGFGAAFVAWEHRPQPEGKNDLGYPLWCWTAGDGVDSENLAALLPSLAEPRNG